MQTIPFCWPHPDKESTPRGSLNEHMFKDGTPPALPAPGPPSSFLQHHHRPRPHHDLIPARPGAAPSVAPPDTSCIASTRFPCSRRKQGAAPYASRLIARRLSVLSVPRLPGSSFRALFPLLLLFAQFPMIDLSRPTSPAPHRPFKRVLISGGYQNQCIDSSRAAPSRKNENSPPILRAPSRNLETIPRYYRIVSFFSAARQSKTPAPLFIYI